MRGTLAQHTFRFAAAGSTQHHRDAVVYHSVKDVCLCKLFQSTQVVTHALLICNEKNNQTDQKLSEKVTLQSICEPVKCVNFPFECTVAAYLEAMALLTLMFTISKLWLLILFWLLI